MAAIVAVLSLLSMWATEGYPIKGVRRIAIPSWDPDYAKFESQVIDSRKRFEEFLKPFNRKNQFERGGGKDDKPVWVTTLEDAKIDFGKETLLLLRQTESSNSTQVWLWLGEESDGSLTGKLYRVDPGASTFLVKGWCFAVVVSREPSRKLTMWEQTFRGSLDLPPKKP